jgi:hypothetical protein
MWLREEQMTAPLASTFDLRGTALDAALWRAIDAPPAIDPVQWGPKWLLAEGTHTVNFFGHSLSSAGERTEFAMAAGDISLRCQERTLTLGAGTFEFGSSR